MTKLDLSLEILKLLQLQNTFSATYKTKERLDENERLVKESAHLAKILFNELEIKELI